MAQDQPRSLSGGSCHKEDLIRLRKQLIERKTGQRVPGSWLSNPSANAEPSPQLAASCPSAPTTPHITSLTTFQTRLAPTSSSQIKPPNSSSGTRTAATAEATTTAIANSYRFMTLMDPTTANSAKEPAPISVTVSPSPSVASRMTPPSQHRPKPGLGTIEPCVKKNTIAEEASTPTSTLKRALAITPPACGNTQPLAVNGVPKGPSLNQRSASVKKFATAAKAKGRVTPYTTPTKTATRRSDKKVEFFDCGDSLERLLLTENDLKLWLEHTRYFDQEHRTKVLDGVKRLKAIDDERNRLVSQVHDDTGVILTPAAPSSSSQSREKGHSAYHRAESPIDRDYRRLSRSRSRSRSPRRHRDQQSSSTPRHVSRSPLRFTWRYDGPSSGSRYHNIDIPNFGRRGLPQDESRPAFASKHRSRLDFGKKGDTRFFLVKSFNRENVRQCQRDGIWVTQVHNGSLLADAFRECRHVILIFSVNQSRAFQGYARISTPPSPSIPPPAWIGTIQFQTTYPLRLEWINTNDTPFSYVGDIKNPLNEYAPVILGRDGQEYSDECGRALIGVIDSISNHERGRY